MLMLAVYDLAWDNCAIMRAEFSHSYPDLQADGFRDDLIAAYGEGGAYEISATLLGSIQDALRNVPLVRQPDLTIQVGIDIDPFSGRETDSLAAYVDSSREIISVILGSTATSGNIVSQLYSSMHHEIGHIAHYQHIEDKDAFYDSPLGAACKEGVADLAANEDFGTSIWENDLTESAAVEIAREELDKIFSGAYDEVDYYDFLFGGDRVPGRGYFVGSYVVSSLALYENLNLKNIMQVPLKRFEDFAKAELL